MELYFTTFSDHVPIDRGNAVDEKKGADDGGRGKEGEPMCWNRA